MYIRRIIIFYFGGIKNLNLFFFGAKELFAPVSYQCIVLIVYKIYQIILANITKLEQKYKGYLILFEIVDRIINVSDIFVLKYNT